MEVRAFALVGAFGCGALLALQSRLNGTLSEASGRPVIAALWSFGSGVLILSILVLLVPPIRRALRDIPTAVRDGRLRWYQCVGGLVGGLFVATQTWTVPLIGVAVFSVASLAGQTLGGLGVDRLGLATSGRHPISPNRLGFALLAVAGVAVSASGRGGAAPLVLLPVLASFVIGGAVALQQAINARVNQAVGQPLATTWQNFFFGTLVLLVVAAVDALARPGSWHLPQNAPWWAWFGAPCGIAFIAITAWAVHHLGVLLFGLTSVAGQLLTALALDLANPGVRPSVGPALVLGVGICLVAALGAGLASARPRPRMGTS